MLLMTATWQIASTLPPFGAVTRWLMIFNRAAQI
jgi:hypothetical protein